MFTDRHMYIYTYTHIIHVSILIHKHIHISFILPVRKLSSIEMKCLGQSLPRVPGLELNHKLVMEVT